MSPHEGSEVPVVTVKVCATQEVSEIQNHGADILMI